MPDLGIGEILTLAALAAGGTETGLQIAGVGQPSQGAEEQQQKLLAQEQEKQQQQQQLAAQQQQWRSAAPTAQSQTGGGLSPSAQAMMAELISGSSGQSLDQVQQSIYGQQPQGLAAGG